MGIRVAVVWMCVVASLCVGLLSGCGSSPLASMNELKAFRGNVEEPWRVALFQDVVGSSNKIETKSQGLRTVDREPIRVFVRNVSVEPAVARSLSTYDAETAKQELTRQVQSSAIRWGRFSTVASESEADLVIDARMSMLVLEGDALKTVNQIEGSYTGFFGSKLSAKEAIDKAREIMRTQITLDFAKRSQGAPIGVHSSQITAFYAKGHGEIVTQAARDAIEAKQIANFNGGKLQPDHLPLLLGEAVDAAFVDSFRSLDESLWKPATQAGANRRSMFSTESAVIPTP